MIKKAEKAIEQYGKKVRHSKAVEVERLKELKAGNARLNHCFKIKGVLAKIDEEESSLQTPSKQSRTFDRDHSRKSLVTSKSNQPRSKYA